MPTPIRKTLPNDHDNRGRNLCQMDESSLPTENLLTAEQVAHWSAIAPLLVCPKGRQPLVVKPAGFQCPCGVIFPIRDGLPALVMKEASLPAGTSIDTLSCQTTTPSN
jgi:uncharacterized protein YbaR (Trm112 family)